NKITLEGKQKCWIRVADKISALGYAERSALNCRKKWLNYSSLVKAADNSRQMKKTGGGPPPRRLDAVEEKVVDIIGMTDVDARKKIDPETEEVEAAKTMAHAMEQLVELQKIQLSVQCEQVKISSRLYEIQMKTTNPDYDMKEDQTLNQTVYLIVPIDT
ncbi:unnamed protein product, partial [Didymodactylos carnosus]